MNANPPTVVPQPAGGTPARRRVTALPAAAAPSLASDRVWIDDADPIYRRGVAGALDEHGFTVAGESAALDPPPPLDGVGILLFDIGGIAAAGALPRPSATRLVALAHGAGEATLRAAIEQGVAGLLERDGLTPASLAASLRAAAAGQGSVPLGALARLASTPAPPPLSREAPLPAAPADATRLPPRERDVLRLLADGGSTRDIAEALAYSERTVKNVVHDLLVKLGCRTRAHAVALAIRRGLI